MFATLIHTTMNKSEEFEDRLQELAWFARSISHPARLAILEYLAKNRTCISGNISQSLPLSRTTVSQHLKELKELGLIHEEIDGLRINNCLCLENLYKYLADFNIFFEKIKESAVKCKI